MTTTKTLSMEEFLAELAKPEPTTRRIYNAAWRRYRTIRRIPRGLRWKRERVKRGFSIADSWDFFAFLSSVIAGGCRELIREGNGHPGELGDGDEGYEAWHTILREIAEGFEASIRATKECEPRPPELDRAFELLAKWWEYLWD